MSTSGFLHSCPTYTTAGRCTCFDPFQPVIFTKPAPTIRKHDTQRRTSTMTDTETTTTTETTETTTVAANDVADLGSVLGSSDPRDGFKTNAIPHDEEATGLPEMVPAPEDEDDGDDSDEDDSENDSTDGGESGPDETGGEGGNA